ncbi:KAP family P-loop NTPase fold protein [Psychrobacter submarinus]|uniref:KAP family P-loop NTPase fold protein n=1 Tax=Psychrobacter submarinus TaxID=154108 RepID=UPI0019189097|nr:P-loop NTPase fold protein [Psychrobacter submarinus]
MELRRHNVEVNDADPFANDWLERKGFADQLTNIVENNKQGEVVIGLSGQWGEGKTTFVKMWQKHMENKDIASIYFDAFEYDYIEDVFLSLAIEIYNYAEVNGLTAQEDYLNKSKNTYHLLQAMIAKTSPINIDSSLQEKLVDNENQPFDIAKIIKDNLNFSLDNAFEQALKKKEVFRDFKKSLSQLATQASNQDIPFIIIIDELDRCKPSFAVEILEKIKHLFLVEGVVFVLSMHHEQLEESIKKVYGQNIDAHTYLQKFIDYPTRLPKADLSNNSNRRKYFYNQVDFIGLPTRPSSSMNSSYELFLLLSIRYDLSYRQLNKALQNYKYLLASLDTNFDNLYPKMFLMVFISILKVKNGHLISKIRNNTATYTDLVENALEVRGQGDFNIETLQNFLKLSFLTIDGFQESEHGSQEASFYNNFAGLIGRNQNKVLMSLVQRLESFEDY